MMILIKEDKNINPLDQNIQMMFHQVMLKVKVSNHYNIDNNLIFKYSYLNVIDISNFNNN